MSWQTDHLDYTQPSQRGYEPLGDTQPTRRPANTARARRERRQRRRSPLRACFWGLLLGLALVVGGYLVFPGRSTILILGIDRTPEGNVVGRSDTIILVDVQTLSAEVRTLSIPRDLWVTIPYWGEYRINTAHFLGEGSQAGGGPALAMATIQQNFGIASDYYLRIQLEEFPAVIDSLGGVKITLPYKMGGLKKGTHKLNGDEALAFVRDRSGTDDFQRMGQGQLFAKALAKNLANPLKWPRLPFFINAVSKVVDTNIPQWEWPRLGFAFVRASFTGVHSTGLNRGVTTPWVTPEGAQVLLPDWGQIIPFSLKALGHR